jgi:stearoyl-CoA desaturase (delta-9 desaturase)
MSSSPSLSKGLSNVSAPKLATSHVAADDSIDWIGAIPFLGIQFAAIVGLFYFPITWKGIALCVGTYLVRMWALTSFSHRYFSHRSFKAGRKFQFFMALMSTLSVQNGVLWWAANHRHHHRFSDMPEDLHSPKQRGFWWAHFGWMLSRVSNPRRYDLVRDLTKYPEIVWLDRYWLVPVVLEAVALVLIGGWTAFYWGFLASILLFFHCTFTVNSIAHIWGKQRYETGDTSRNNFWIALITLGEGWHNNHHHYQSSARQGFYWWEIDPSYYGLKLMEKAGLIWDVRVPPEKILLEGKGAKAGGNAKAPSDRSLGLDQPIPHATG